MTRLSFDRMEEGFAVLIDKEGRSQAVDPALLPPGAVPGATVCLEDGRYSMDLSDGEARARRIRDKMNRLFEK